MDEQDKAIYSKLDGQHKAVYQLLKKHIDKRAEEHTAALASLEAFILTITNSEEFQRIIAKELEKIANEGDKNDEATST